MFLEKQDYSPCNHVTRLIVQEYCIVFNFRPIFILKTPIAGDRTICTYINTLNGMRVRYSEKQQVKKWCFAYFMFLWPCIVSKAWRKNTNKMQQYRCLLSIQVFNIDYRLDMFRASLCPSSGEKDHVLLHMSCLLVVLDVAGCGTVVLRCRVWALWRLLFKHVVFFYWWWT